jgi:hypothetical protein
MSLIIMRGPLLAAALALAACGHTRSVDQPASEQDAHPAKKQARPKKPTDEDKPKPRETGTLETPVPRTPAAAIEPGQLRQIQARLAQRKLLGQHESGTLDPPTEEALRRLQHDEDLPETGLPDHETVRKLGLDPDQVFAKRRGEPGR